MKDEITVLHARDIKQASRIAGKRPFTWLYLGHNIRQRENVAQALGKENRYPLGNLLQQVAHQQRQPFLDFIAELGHHQKNKLHWWASNTAYKNPLSNDLFLLWCYAAIFENIRTEPAQEKDRLLLFLVEDRWLYRHLYERYKGSRSSPSFMSRKSTVPELLKLAGRGIAGRGYFLLMAGWQIWRAKGTGNKNNATSQNNGREIYIYSWIRERFFQKNGDFKDAYFGRLPQIMSSSGLSVVYIAPLFLPPALKSKCLNHEKYRFIFLDDCVNLRSLTRSFLSVLRISYLPRLNSKFPSFRILLLREMAYEFSSFPSNILDYFAFKKCLKDIKQKEMIIIFPFENQPWQRMLCLAAREVDKKIKLIGYQHATISRLLINHFPGGGESKDMPLPHLIVTNSETALNLYKNAGYGEVEFVNGGALRYEYLHKMERDSTRQKGESKTVLVALPYSRSLSEEMLLVIFNAFKDLTEEKLRFTIKFHPEVPLERLEIQLHPWPAHFQRTDKPTPEILEEVDLVIYSSSTVGLEALLGKAPVVRYYSEHVIELDPLDTLGEKAVKSCSESNMKQVVLSVLTGENSHSAEDFIPDTDIINSFLSPVDEDVWHRIVKL